MRTLHIYGDSYASNHEVTDLVNDYNGAQCWTNLIADNLKMQQCNHARAGTSTSYSLLKLKEHSDDILRDDVVIFCVSSFERLTFIHQHEFPDTAATLTYERLPKSIAHMRRHVWYKENAAHLEWFARNTDINNQKLIHEGYMHIIRNFAECNPDVTVLLMSLDHYNVKFPMSIPRNLLIPAVTLYSISAAETKISYREFTKYTGYDPRINHYSINNSKTFANLVTEAIQTNSVENFTLDKFESNIYTRSIDTVEEYDRHIAAGNLFDRVSTRTRLKKL
jgi:hypothetical protein